MAIALAAVGSAAAVALSIFVVYYCASRRRKARLTLEEKIESVGNTTSLSTAGLYRSFIKRHD